MLKLGFGAIETALQEMHGVAAGKQKSFRARLRYLQQRVDIGLPRSGVGRRSNFSIGHALLFALAIELEHFGMAPERVEEAVRALGLDAEMGTLREAVYEVADRLGSDRPAVLLWFIPEALSDAISEAAIPDMAARTIQWSEVSQIPSEMFSPTAPAFRLAVINLSALTAALIEQLNSDRADCVSALTQWANDEEAQ